MAEHVPDDRIVSGQPTPPPSAIRANPPEAARAPILPGDADRDVQLNDLIDAAGAKQINSARTTLIVIGVLTIVANIVLALLAQGQVDDELRKQGINPNQLPAEQQAIQRVALMIHYAMLTGFALIGGVFIGLGVMVRKYPVPCTIAGLGLYILGNLIQLAIYPASLTAGWIIKIIIIVALFKAVQAALTAERQKREALASMDAM